MTCRDGSNPTLLRAWGRWPQVQRADGAWGVFPELLRSRENGVGGEAAGGGAVHLSDPQQRESIEDVHVLGDHVRRAPRRCAGPRATRAVASSGSVPVLEGDQGLDTLAPLRDPRPRRTTLARIMPAQHQRAVEGSFHVLGEHLATAGVDDVIGPAQHASAPRRG